MQAWFLAHWVDLAILLTLAWYGLDGWRRGFVALCLDTAGFLTALLAAILAYRPLGDWASGALSLPPSFGNAASFFGVWWLADLIWPIIAREIESRLPAKWRAAKIGKVFGLIPGLANGALVLSVILTVVSAFPVPSELKRQASDAQLARPLRSISGRLDNLLSPVLGPLADEGINLLTVHPGSGDRIDLHFTVRDAAVDTDSENRMLDLLNAERVKRGLGSLPLDLGLTIQARAHGRDMFALGYFSHIDQAGRSPADRLEAAGLPYGLMGENLALAPDVTVAHEGLMESPGHRANILGAGFRRVGIGVLDGGIYGKMFVQEFTD